MKKRLVISRGLPGLACFVATIARAAAQAPEEDIRGAKPVVEIPVPHPPPVMLWVGIASALIALALAVWWWRSRNRLVKLTPRDIAMNGLRDLGSHQDAVAAGWFASQAAFVVRSFLEARFGLAAPRRTTEEFLRQLTGNEALVGPAACDALRGFLTACDLAKFANAPLDSMQRATLLDQAREFIRAVDQPEPGKA